ncbi:tetratricopeptide repeat protein [Streptosporangium sp. NPDC051023]|uniref:tetratricopeptide repeat protein n=1 Tax=Streptosporangium sp. NPDC051023 TaxID=3155410 RepID=UPI00344DFDC8
MTTADGLPEAVLGTLSVADVRLSGTPLERVVNLLAGGEGVLVLDNCEQISGPVAEFAGQLLERQPYLTILATSREPLEVMGETLCRLGPLDLPPAHADSARAGESAAVRLFLDRAAAVQPGFTLDALTAASVVDIVRRLDGLPLALELAAARLRTMSADQSDRWAIACTFMIEAMRYCERGDRENSATAMAVALYAFEEVGDRWWTAKTLYGLAQIHAIAGDHDQAITAYEHSIAIVTDLGSQDEVSTRLGLATDDHGDTELCSLAEVLAERLGRTDYDTAYQRGAGITPREATDRLTRLRV